MANNKKVDEDFEDSDDEEYESPKSGRTFGDPIAEVNFD